MTKSSQTETTDCPFEEPGPSPRAVVVWNLIFLAVVGLCWVIL